MNVVRVDPVAPEPGVIERAAAILKRGGLVAFPTETVYGLGANALDEAAVLGIFAAKRRALDDPLIVHLASVDDLQTIVTEIPPVVHALAERFWPGPLTLVLPKRPIVPDAATAGLPTVAVRVPSHPVAQALIRAAGRPIAAPSANLFTRASATTAAHVVEDLGDRVDLILDGGPAPFGIESTVVRIAVGDARLLRPGATTHEDLELVSDPGETVRVVRLGSESDLAQVAGRLFAALRDLDAAGCDAIYTRALGTSGLGLAILDRLTRAAHAE